MAKFLRFKNCGRCQISQKWTTECFALCWIQNGWFFQIRYLIPEYIIAVLVFLSQNQIYIKIVLYEKHVYYLWIWPKEYMINTILFFIRLGEINFIRLNIKTSNFVVPVRIAFRCQNFLNLVEIIIVSRHTVSTYYSNFLCHIGWNEL